MRARSSPIIAYSPGTSEVRGRTSMKTRSPSFTSPRTVGLIISSDDMAKPIMPRSTEPNQKRRMHARPLIRKKKYPRHRRFEDGDGMLAFQFDIADLGIFRSRLWPQRRLPLLKGQRHKLVLLVEGVNQTAIGRSRRQEFLGPSVSRYGEGGSNYDGDGEVILDLAQAASSSDKGAKGRHTLAMHTQGSREARQPWAGLCNRFAEVLKDERPAAVSCRSGDKVGSPFPRSWVAESCIAPAPPSCCRTSDGRHPD